MFLVFVLQTVNFGRVMDLHEGNKKPAVKMIRIVWIQK